MLKAAICSRKRIRSCKLMCLAMETCKTAARGPIITPLADVPNEPRTGAEKAVASNHRFTLRWSYGRFGLRTILGRIVTSGGRAKLAALPARWPLLGRARRLQGVLRRIFQSAEKSRGKAPCDEARVLLQDRVAQL